MRFKLFNKKKLEKKRIGSNNGEFKEALSWDDGWRSHVEMMEELCNL